MELLNTTGMVAGFTQGMDSAAREYLVVVVKGTFILPSKGTEAVLSPNQLPLVEADSFTGEPGFSAVMHESDYAPVKPRCDVLVNGSAYAPGGKPAAAVDVGLRLGNINKVLRVIGDRYWIGSPGGIGVTFAEPFTRKTITYDLAFGGTDNFNPDPNKKDAYMVNPIGRGFHRFLASDLVHDTPLPNTEEPGNPVTWPQGNYKPMGFGVIGRSWPDRARYAGTYDQNWVDDVFPFLPRDFDNRYYQAAPEDQQCSYLQGGERVQLLNLTESGFAEFTIPTMTVPVVFFRKRGEDVHTHAVADTLVIEPDLGIFTLTWRIAEPLRKNMFEVPQILVGKKSRAWWRARMLGKTYHRSLTSVASPVTDIDDD